MPYDMFFSTIAQCSAAIVGIIAAFIINYLLKRESNFALHRADLKSAIEEAKVLARSGIHVDFRELNELIFIYVKRTAKKVLEETKYLDELKKFEDKESCKADIEFTLDLSPFDIRQHLKWDEIFSMDMAGIDFEKKGIEEINKLWHKVIEFIADVERSVQNCKRVSINVKTMTQKSVLTQNALLLIVALFFIGVIYPISFLPTTFEIFSWGDLSFYAAFEIIQTPKGILLLVISLLFLTIVTVMYIKNNALVFDPSHNDIKKLNIHSEYYPYVKTHFREEQARFLYIHFHLAQKKDIIKELKRLESMLHHTISISLFVNKHKKEFGEHLTNSNKRNADG